MRTSNTVSCRDRDALGMRPSTATRDWGSTRGPRRWFEESNPPPGASADPRATWCDESTVVCGTATGSRPPVAYEELSQPDLRALGIDVVNGSRPPWFAATLGPQR